ncbi:MAG: hypothetical protein Q8P28_02255 [Deltaproteobacteria bacterium]|nr:hypothetical protein [Deltaproteobacteria bacterium]
MPVGLKMIRGADVFFSFSSEGITGNVTACATDVLSGSGLTSVTFVSVSSTIGKAGTAIGFWGGSGTGAGAITDFTSTGGAAGFGASATTTATAVGEGTVADFSASAAFTSVVTTEGSVVTGVLADMAGSVVTGVLADMTGFEKGFGFEQPIKTVKITSGITLEIHFIK